MSWASASPCSRRLLVPARRLGLVLRHAPALVIAKREVALAAGIALLGRAAQPADRLARDRARRRGLRGTPRPCCSAPAHRPHARAAPTDRARRHSRRRSRRRAPRPCAARPAASRSKQPSQPRHRAGPIARRRPPRRRACADRSSSVSSAMRPITGIGRRRKASASRSRPLPRIASANDGSRSTGSAPEPIWPRTGCDARPSAALAQRLAHDRQQTLGQRADLGRRPRKDADGRQAFGQPRRIGIEPQRRLEGGQPHLVEAQRALHRVAGDALDQVPCGRR